MQRRSTVLLLKRAINLAPKRPFDGVPVAAAGAPTPSTPPRSAPFASPAASTPAAAAPPPAGAAPSGVSGGLRKKKIIRRIVKRKKASAGGAPSSAASAAPPAAAAAAAGATGAATAASAEAPQTSRAQAMLHAIRQQPEGALAEEAEEKQQQHNTAQAAAEEENQEEAYHAVQHPTTEVEEEAPAVEEVAAAPTTHSAPKSAAGHAATQHHGDSAAERYAADMEALHDETDESAGPTSTSSSGRKTAMVKGYRIDEVSNLCSPSDAMFARRLPSGGCQFFAWPGTPLSVAAKAIMSMPDTIRTVHAVFGRVGTPMDIVMDIDCQVPQEYWTMTKIRPFQMKLLDDVLTVLKEEIEKIGESIETQVVLQSPNLKKASFHVHTKLKDAAFADYNSLHGFLCKFQERMPNVDMQIYRPNGMLRMFHCMKENHTSAIVVFDDPKWNLGFPGGKVSDEQAALHSVCVRDPSTFTRTLTFASPRAYMSGAFHKEDGAAADGERPPLPPQTRLPRTEKEAIANASRWLRGATEVEVGEWRSWIGLGLCAFRLAHHFRNAKGLPRPAMEEMLDAWTEASRKCPLKYHPGECETRWAAFSPDKLGDRSDWWGAYKRLSRLDAAVMEAVAEEAAEKAEKEARFGAKAKFTAAAEAAVAAAAAGQSTSPSSAAPSAEQHATEPPRGAAAAGGSSAAAAETRDSVGSASRKLKLKKRAMRGSS